ncbi:hypothetical protein [Streptomyces sp. NPDC002851]
MFGRRQETAVLVLRDSDELTETLRWALDRAPEEERAGLRRALELVAETAATSDAEIRVRWTRAQLAAAGYQGPGDDVRAVKALRDAQPGLSLAQAVEFTKEAAAAG